MGFFEAFGISPIAYAKNLRLTNARRDLIKKTWPTVTEITMHWNFQHLDRFSQNYQQAYGEPQSETFRRNVAKPEASFSDSQFPSQTAKRLRLSSTNTRAIS